MSRSKIIVKKSSIANMGAFASEDIPAGTFIIEYIGEKIDNDEAERRETINDEIGVTYIFCLDDEYCIDGANFGNDAKYVNHSCEPNCRYAIENGKINFYSLRDIKKGEELTIDYAYDMNSKKEICLCGTKSCRGIINK